MFVFWVSLDQASPFTKCVIVIILILKTVMAYLDLAFVPLVFKKILKAKKWCGKCMKRWLR